MRSELLAENLSSATSASLLAGRAARIHTSAPTQILGRYVIFRNVPCTDLGDRIRHMFDTVNRACLKDCPIVDEFFHAFPSSIPRYPGVPDRRWTARRNSVRCLSVHAACSCTH